MWFLGGVFWVVEGMWERFSSRDMIWSNQQEQPFWVIVISRRLSLLVSWGSKGTPSMPILLGGMALGEFLYIVRDPLGESPTATCKPTGRGLRKIRGELVVKLRACSCSYPVVKKGAPWSQNDTNTPLNVAIENWWLEEDYFPREDLFSGAMLVLGRVVRQNFSAFQELRKRAGPHSNRCKTIWKAICQMPRRLPYLPRSLGHQDILFVGFVHSKYVVSPFS